MNKENWKKHIEGISGLVRPSHLGDIVKWQTFLKSHCQECKECMARKVQQRKNLRARELNQVLRDITGTSARSAKLDMGL